MEKNTPLSTFHCNQLQHTRSACFKTDLPDHFRFNFVQVVNEPCGSIVLLWRHGGHVTETRDFQLQTTQMLEASCLFSFKSILLRTSGKCQSIKRIACMLNFIYIVQSKWYLRLKISVQGPFNRSLLLPATLRSAPFDCRLWPLDFLSAVGAPTLSWFLFGGRVLTDWLYLCVNWILRLTGGDGNCSSHCCSLNETRDVLYVCRWQAGMNINQGFVYHALLLGGYLYIPFVYLLQCTCCNL